MVNDMPYGKCLTQEEYSNKINEMYQEIAPGTARKYSPEEISVKEFNLLIDFKLGVDFPEEKRKILTRSRKRIQMYHVKLVKRFQTGELSNEEFAMEVEQKIPAMMVEEFAKILPPEELNKLFDIVDGQVPVIPVDHTKLR
jgi:hypothetical protein